MYFKKFLAIILTLMMIVCVLPADFAFAQSGKTVHIGLLADSHITTDSSSIEKALDVFSQTAPDYEGLVLAGDMIMHHYNMVNFQNGVTEVSDTINDTGYNTLKSLFSEKNIVTLDNEGNISEKNKGVLYAAGNHEFPQNVDITKEGHQAIADASKEMYVSQMGMPLLNDEVIGGYHFITAFPEDYGLSISKESEDYIMEKVASSISEDITKPVFLVMHTTPFNTTYPSTEQAYSQRFVEFLESTPQLIMITGHMHNTQYDPRMIWQGGYSVLSLSCLDESASEKSEAAMLEITDNVVRVKRFDLRNNCVIGTDKEFDIPNMVENPGNSDYWKYNNNRPEKFIKPEFSEDAKIDILSIGETEVELEFPAVQKNLSDDDYMISSYRIQIIDKALGSKAADVKAETTDNILPAHLRNAKITKKVTALDSGREYIANVSALDVWGNESDAITTSFSTEKGENDEEEIKYNSPKEDERVIETKYIKSVKEGETEATANYTEFTGGAGRGPFKDSRGPGEYFIVFYEAEMSISFEFNVEKSGMYDLMVETDSLENCLVRAKVDGIQRKPVTLIGKGVWYNMGTVYSSLGKVALEAGTHTVTVEIPQKLTAELHLWSISLAKDQEAHVIDMFCTEGTAWEGHYSNYTKDKNTLAYQFYGDGYGAIDFEFTAPVNGDYLVTVQAAGGSADNTFTVYANGNEETYINLPAGVASTIATHTAAKPIKLSKGTNTIRLCAGRTSAPFFRSIAIISYDLTDLWNIYPTSSENVVSFSGGHSGDTDLSADLIMMASGDGYITYSITPSKTGKYSFSWQLYSKGFYAQTLVNGEVISENYYEQTKGYTEPITAVLIGGKTYDITLKAVTSGHAYVYAMRYDYVSPPDNGGEGVYYDIYAGDSTDDNYELTGASGIKYGDGRVKNGWGCYGGLYAEFKTNIEFAGWYDVTLVLGAAQSSLYKLTIDGVDYPEKTTEFVSGETWAVKRNNEIGEIFLMPGEHTFKITGVSGTFMIYKTRFAYNRQDDGTAPISFTYDCLSYTDKGGANVQTYTKPYHAMVIAEGNSYAEYTVDVPEGNYVFELCYGASSWDGQMSIKVNNNLLGTYPLPQTGTSVHQPLYDVNRYYSPEILSLKEGRNTIKIQCEPFADYQNNQGYAYFSYTTFKLTRIKTPSVSMYERETISPYNKVTELKNGDMAFKVYLPRAFANKDVRMYVVVYKDNRLYKITNAETKKATNTDYLTAFLHDIEKEDTSSYSLRFFFWNTQGNITPLCEDIEF